MAAPAPEQALEALAEQLRAEDTVITSHVRDADERPGLGELASAGPRAAERPGEYALLTESIREGYLLHYGTPRVVSGADPDLALLAGDYLYARGLERLAALGDLEAVRELSDLISLCAQAHAEEEDADGRAGVELAAALWLAAVAAVAAGPTDGHEAAKRAARLGELAAAEALLEAARAGAGRAGLGDALTIAADSVGFALPVDVLDDLG